MNNLEQQYDSFHISTIISVGREQVRRTSVSILRSEHRKLSISASCIQTKTQGFDNLGMDLDAVPEIESNDADSFSDSEQMNGEEIDTVNDPKIHDHHVTSPQCSVREKIIFLKKQASTE